MNLKDCHNVEDFRKLAKKKLPSPIFHYIDGGSDDEITLKRNTDSFNNCDLIPNVLTGADDIDLSTTVLGQKIDFPLFLSATAMHRLYNYEGEKASARAAGLEANKPIWCRPGENIDLLLTTFCLIFSYLNVVTSCLSESSVNFCNKRLFPLLSFVGLSLF